MDQIKVEDFGLLPSKRSTYKVGQHFGRWTILALGSEPTKERSARAVAQCDCGSPPKKVGLQNIVKGLSKDCGCGRREKLTTHGLASRNGSTREGIYRVWLQMTHRCQNPDHPAYENYGGRGITVCDRWQNVSNFVADMGPAYQPDLTLERRDNSSGYSPKNCFWATNAAQTRNRRTTLVVTHDGKTKSLGEWAEEAGMPYNRLYYRLRRGWPFNRAISEPHAYSK